MKILSWLFRNTANINALESSVIEAIAESLPDASAKVLRVQVQLINKVQRLDQDREVDLYRIEKGKIVFPENALFANQSDEFELARLKVTDTETGHGTNAVVSLVKGRLFCIEFSHDPRDLKESRNLQIIVQSIVDPMIISK
jgi:hypothetical protein